MNNPRRKQLQKAIELLASAREIIESVRDDEQEAFDNMPESLQYSERGERMEENVEVLGEAIMYVEEYENALDDIINE